MRLLVWEDILVLCLEEESRRCPTDIQDKKLSWNNCPRSEVAIFCVLAIKEQAATLVTSDIIKIDSKAVFSGSRRGGSKGLLAEINHK